MFIFLQIWGASCFLLNKIYLAKAENKSNNRAFLIFGWTIYLMGIPAWEIIFIRDENWIAAAVQIGVAPSMVLGLITAIRNNNSPPKWLVAICQTLVYLLVFVGVVYSIYDYGGLTAITQACEIMNMIGFLVGTYLLAQKKPNGWLFFIPMNIGMGFLMAIEGNYIMAIQQIISLCFVIYGYLSSKKVHYN